MEIDFDAAPFMTNVDPRAHEDEKIQAAALKQRGMAGVLPPESLLGKYVQHPAEAIPAETDEGWRDQAKCKSMPVEWFFASGKGGRVNPKAQDACRECPVNTQCDMHLPS